MSREYIMLILIVQATIVGCQKKAPMDERLKANLIDYAQSLRSRDLNKIREITTEKGFHSVLDWSDSLKNDTFLNQLVANIEREKIFSVTNTDSLTFLSLGQADEVTGATGGYLILRQKKAELKIEEYRGGK